MIGNAIAVLPAHGPTATPYSLGKLIDWKLVEIDGGGGVFFRQKFSSTPLINRYLTINYPLKLEQIDKLKTGLDGFRPFSNKRPAKTHLLL